jgi:hypothetical protein
MTTKEKIDERQEQDLAAFMERYPYLTTEGIPVSLIKLCYYNGYMSAINSVERLLKGEGEYKTDTESL